MYRVVGDRVQLKLSRSCHVRKIQIGRERLIIRADNFFDHGGNFTASSISHPRHKFRIGALDKVLSATPPTHVGIFFLHESIFFFAGNQTKNLSTQPLKTSQPKASR